MRPSAVLGTQRRCAASYAEILLVVGAIAAAAVAVVVIAGRVLARRARDASRALDGRAVPPSNGASDGRAVPPSNGASDGAGLPAADLSGPASSGSGGGTDPTDDWGTGSVLLGDDVNVGIEEEEPCESNLAPKEVVRRTKEMQEDLLGGLRIRKKRMREKERIKIEEAAKRRAKAEEYRKRAQAEGGKNEKAAQEAEAAARLWEEKARKAEAEAKRAGEEAGALEQEEKDRDEARRRRAELMGAGAPATPAVRQSREQEARKHRGVCRELAQDAGEPARGLGEEPPGEARRGGHAGGGPGRRGESRGGVPESDRGQRSGEDRRDRAETRRGRGQAEPARERGMDPEDVVQDIRAGGLRG